MAGTTITPTRMMLKQLKGRLKTARRGHKLMKDKRDELMRQFMDIVRLNKQLRERVEQGLTEAFAALQVASAIMSPEMLEQALLYPRSSVTRQMSFAAAAVMAVSLVQQQEDLEEWVGSTVWHQSMAAVSREQQTLHLQYLMYLDISMRSRYV